MAFHLRKTQFGFCLYTVHGSNPAPPPGSQPEFLSTGGALLRVGVDDRRIDDAIFASWHRPQLRLDGDAFAPAQPDGERWRGFR